MDVRSGKWERANVQGEPPSPRAAHAAAAVGSMVVVQVSLTIGTATVNLLRMNTGLLQCVCAHDSRIVMDYVAGWHWASGPGV